MVLDILHRGYTNPSNKNKRKPFKWILGDSLIIGGITACAVMSSSIPTITDCWIIFKTFLGSFLAQLVIERGIKRSE